MFIISSLIKTFPVFLWWDPKQSLTQRPTATQFRREVTQRFRFALVAGHLGMGGNQLTVEPTSSILAAATLPLQPGGLVRAPRQSALASGPRSKTVKCGKVALKK